MLMLKEYIIQNWALILVSLAFLISLRTTSFLDKTFANRMCLLILEVLILSVIVFVEFFLNDHGIVWKGRPVLMAIRYSATPFIDAQVLYTLIKKLKRAIFIPAVILAILCFINIFTNIICRPIGLYGSNLIYVLYRRSNKQSMELIPIAFFALTLGSGVILPFLLGPIYSHIFCETISIALFTYYLFSILNLTKQDSLTGLLNRQACYADMETEAGSITALVSMDMNGLKRINDTRGHAAGDDALTTLALCFKRAAKSHQSVYRIGGDEFLIICQQALESDVHLLIDRIRRNVAETEFTCAIGYSCSENGSKSISEMLKESDEMMYAEKAKYYKTAGIDRRRGR